VVLSATRFLSQLERRTVRRDLLPLGLRNLFFPVTMIDLLDALSDEPDAALAHLKDRARQVLAPLCEVDGEDRFADRFFPLDARSALNSRWDRGTGQPKTDTASWQDSGMAGFEEALEHFLVDERGHAQLTHLASVARLSRDALAQQAALDQAAADASLEDLEARQLALEPQLAELRAVAGRVGRIVDDFIGRQQVLVWQDLRQFLSDTERELPAAVSSFDLGPMAGLNLLRPSGRAVVEAKIRVQLDEWLEDRVAGWQASLRPRIERMLDDLRAELAAEAADFDALARDIAQGFAGSMIRAPTHDSTTPTVGTVERWFSVAVGALMLSPGTVAAGWVAGYEGALKGAASRLGVRLAVVALGALLGPVGWAGLLLYAVSDVLLIGLTGGSQLRQLRGQVSDRLRGTLVKQADAAREVIAEQVAEGMAPLREALVDTAAAEADDLAQALQATIEARRQASADADARTSQYADALKQADEIVGELDALCGATEPHAKCAAMGPIGL
jgi:hypothetical protein